YVTYHNKERAMHGAGPLTWNPALSLVAQSWADKCEFKHSGGSYGENLAAGTDLTIGQAMQSWIDEEQQYKPDAPEPSNWTQMVWKHTYELGCAKAPCNGTLGSENGTTLFYVCEYNPAGNVDGEFS
ncbi:PR-1-like protein, partial [Fistulina hepatica ATCC 64428]